MKYYETTFEEYTNSVAQYNYHPELCSNIKQPAVLSSQSMQNRIYYGATGTGKYSQVLYYLKRFSPSALKYDKKMTIQTEKTSYQYRFSDVHYEIDMALLGCNSKTLWEVFFNQVVDILSVKAGKSGVLVCKNFHCIHTELLEVFISYMKQYQYSDTIFNKNGLCLKYILITEHVSFIPSSILNHCEIINICRPSKQIMTQIKSPQIAEALKTIDAECIVNLKELEMFHYHTADIPCDIFNIVCRALLEEMKKITQQLNTNTNNNNNNNNSNPFFMRCRGLLYDISIYQLDVMECLWFLLGSLIQQGYLTDTNKIGLCLKEIAEFLKYYNNNYRTIYHFESIFYFIQSHLSLPPPK